jgi:hypothetical protein
VRFALGFITGAVASYLVAYAFAYWLIEEDPTDDALRRAAWDALP